jgi:hypothetical protein
MLPGQKTTPVQRASGRVSNYKGMIMKSKPRLISMCVLFLLIFTGMTIHAQQGVQYPQQNRAAQYFLGSEDELLVPVNIWGFVQKPGQYMVPNNTNLISLLSFAGGPTENARISNIRIVRSSSQTDKKVWKVNVRKYIETADEALIPLLKPGDTIIVKGTTFHWISKFFEFISRLTAVAQIVYFIALAQEYLTR